MAADPTHVASFAASSGTNVRYTNFADIVGDYAAVVKACEALRPPYLVRQDGFMRGGREVHRVYLTHPEQYLRLATIDTFASVRGGR